MVAAGTGSGFFITTDGYFVTNHHVIDGAKRIEIKAGQQRFPATLLKTDPANDVAILKAEGQFTAVPLGEDDEVVPGEEVFTVGYPLSTELGQAPKTTVGTISALSGMKDDPTNFQISVQIQPGNSGGPLALKANGNVVGITSSSASATYFAGMGIIPQNVNYAVKAAYIRPLFGGIQGLKEKLVAPAKDAKAFREVQKQVEASSGLVTVFKEDQGEDPPPAPQHMDPEEVPPADNRLLESVEASSILSDQATKAEGRIKYQPANLFDKDASTAWVEGAASNGVGEWVEVSFLGPVELSKLRILGGYGKNQDIFKKNTRVKTLELTCDGGARFTLRFEDTIKTSEFALPKPVITTTARLKITEVYPGSKYRDAAISEVEFQ